MQFSVVFSYTKRTASFGNLYELFLIVSYSSVRFTGQLRLIPVSGPPRTSKGKNQYSEPGTGLTMKTQLQTTDQDSVIAALWFNCKLKKK